MIRATRERRWRHPWQVVRIYPNGPLLVVCSHRTLRRARLCLTLQHALSRHGYDLDTRPTPRRNP